MKWLLPALLVGFACRSADRDGGADLRINHLQVRGTHNSYHLRPRAVIEAWAYEHVPLVEQLERQRVRQLEFDVHYEPMTHDFSVYHVRGVDAETLCDTLRRCLADVRAWSDAHPGHHMLFIFIEPKDDIDRDKIREHFAELEAAVDSVWPRDLRIEPDDLRGEYADPNSAARAGAWPTLEESRGKALFVLFDQAQNRAAYTDPDPSLTGRLFFAVGNENDPFAAFISNDDAVGQEASFRAAVQAGFIVRTRVELLTNMEAGLRSGVHLLSTDFPQELSVPQGTLSRCNPISAPADCKTEWIEAVE